MKGVGWLQISMLSFLVAAALHTGSLLTDFFLHIRLRGIYRFCVYVALAVSLCTEYGVNTHTSSAELASQVGRSLSNTLSVSFSLYSLIWFLFLCCSTECCINLHSSAQWADGLTAGRWCRSVECSVDISTSLITTSLIPLAKS